MKAHRCGFRVVRQDTLERLHLSGARFPTYVLPSQGVVFQRLGSDQNWFSGSLTLGML